MSNSMKYRFDELMKKKNLNQIVLLMQIHNMLYPEKSNESYDFAKKRKGNFSKMINGTRPFKYEYVVPLERILNTTMDYIINGEESNVGIQLRNKGIEYTAYLNDYDEYVKFGVETDSEGNLIISNYDEYNKNLLNYIIEYQSEQGIAYLYNYLNFKYNAMISAFECKPHIYVHDVEEQLLILKLLASKNETILLRNVINPYQIIDQHLERNDGFLKSKEFKEFLLTNENVLNVFLDDNTMNLMDVNSKIIYSTYSFDQSMFINPILYDLLEFAFENGTNYISQIYKIIDFGIEYNKRMIEFANKTFSSLEEIKIDKKGFIIHGCIKIGSLLIYDHTINPDFPETIKNKLRILDAQKNALLNLEQPSVMADSITADGKYIWRQASENDVEYEMYKLCEKLEIHEIPKYYETREGLDCLDYISGSVLRHCGNANYNQVASLVSWLKKYQDKLGDALGGKVYVHGALNTDAVLFENDEVKGIVGWQFCRIGEIYEDFVSILIDWLDLGSTTRSNSRIYDTMMKLVKEFEMCTEIKKILPELIMNELNQRISKLDKNSDNYEYWYEYYRYAQTFVELYAERIKEDI